MNESTKVSVQREHVIRKIPFHVEEKSHSFIRGSKMRATATRRFRQSFYNTMLLLSEQNVKECLSMKDCLEVNRKALIAVANGDAQVPTRLGLQYLSPSMTRTTTTATTDNAVAVDWTLFKPAAHTTMMQQEAHLDRSTSNMGMKLVSIRAQNPLKGLPLVPATILSVHPETGLVQAVVAATYLTAARTAAGSALSTLLVKEGNVHRVTVFGAGLQAKLHIQALATAMRKPIPHLTIVNRTLETAKRLQSELPPEWALESHVQLLSDTGSVDETLSQTDVVVTATNTITPLFSDRHVRPETHFCGVGSYTPDMQEISATTVNRCRVLIDTPEARSVGDLKHLTMSHPVALLGNVLTTLQAMEPPSKCGSTTTTETKQPPAWFPEHEDVWSLDCTFFKSVGTAIQDVLTADMVVQKAKQLQIGTEVDMS